MSEVRILTFPDPSISYVRGPSVTLNFPSGFQQPEATFEFGQSFGEDARFRIRGTMELAAGSLSASAGGASVSLGSGATFDETLVIESEADIITFIGDDIDGKVTSIQVDLVS